MGLILNCSFINVPEPSLASAERNLQIHAGPESDEGAVGVASAVADWHPYAGSNPRSQAENHEQNRLGQQVGFRV